jgi:hypothetical protein
MCHICRVILLEDFQLHITASSKAYIIPQKTCVVLFVKVVLQYAFISSAD